jgi:hypothetical protein
LRTSSPPQDLHTPRRQAGIPSPLHAAPRSKVLHNPMNACLLTHAMNNLFFPFKANREILHLPRCAPTKLPDPLRADALSRPTTNPCNTQGTLGAQRSLFHIRLVLQRSLTFLPPWQLRGSPPTSWPPQPLTRSSCGRSRCGGNVDLRFSLT